MSYQDVKVICQVTLLNKMLFVVDLGVGEMFYMSIMLEFDHWSWNVSFLPSYFSIIFLAKAKISKSVSLFLSHTGPKWCWPIRLQDFKLNISLEQSNEIVYFFTCWYQKLRADRNISVVWPEMVVAILVTRWMDEWIDQLSWFFMLMRIKES